MSSTVRREIPVSKIFFREFRFFITIERFTNLLWNETGIDLLQLRMFLVQTFT